MLVILQIRSGSKVLKSWYGCSVTEQLQLFDLFTQFAAGNLDNSSALRLPDEYSTAAVECAIGRGKDKDLTKVSVSLTVAEAVSALGQFIDFNVSVSARHLLLLDCLPQLIEYSYGSGLQEIEHDVNSVLSKVFTRMNLSCTSPIEFPYYSTNHEPLCFYCGSLNVTSSDADTYPMCEECVARNRPPVTRRKRAAPATASTNAKRKKA